MTRTEIIERRLAAHLLVSERKRSIADVVAWFGATQAQDQHQAKWALGARVPDSTMPLVEQAQHDRHYVRTWTMRGTLHHMAPNDVAWINGYLGKRVLSIRGALYREYGFDAKTLAKIEAIILGALAEGPRTRSELKALLEAKKQRTDGFRFAHMMYHLALSGYVCCGAPRGKQDTYVLLKDWVGHIAVRSSDESLVGLASLYFRSHGPATMRDFAWWAGIPQRDAIRGIELIRDELTSATSDRAEYLMIRANERAEIPKALLLSGFDEYLLGYGDRSVVLDEPRSREVVTVNGLFRPTIVIGGRVVGMWSREIGARQVDVTLTPFRALKPAERRAVESEAARVAAFIGKELTLNYE